ncbi:MAG: macro domain-containing protein, partial [Candidatus Omnitrophica bacterium]|nr:macro domain-containing protein [Candidatus Omnitrophota bacterium]
CRELNGCLVGEAKITAGYNLPCKHVIHTVGPVWRGGKNKEADLLAACYVRSLKLCVQHRLAAVAFPCISTGVYGYPKEPAARIAVATVKAFLQENDIPATVTFCCFSEPDAEFYRGIL